MHLWWDNSFKIDDVGLINDKYSLAFPPNYLQEIISTFNPRKCIVEHPFFIPLTINFKEFARATPKHIMPLFYSVQSVFKSVNERYDWYVKTRFDIILESTLSFNFESLDENCIYISNKPSDFTGCIFHHKLLEYFQTVFTRISEYGGICFW